MRKILKAVFGSLILIVAISWILNPQLFKIVWFQKPAVDTYTHFPLRKVEASRSPMYFEKASNTKGNLDSLLVKNWENKSVSFSEYFTNGDLLAFLVIQNDTIVYEKYGEGFRRETMSNTFSIGKTMVSIAIGKAIAQGYIQNSNQKVVEFIPELKGTPNFDKATIHDLLNMKSGLKFKRAGDGMLSDLFCDEARFYYTSNLKNDLLNVKADTIAGIQWKYSNLDPLFLTWLLEKVTGKHFSDYFEKEIWQAIGAQYQASWGLDKEDGLENSPSSFQCTAIDLAKIGSLYLKDGIVNNVSIIDKKWIEKSLVISEGNRGNTAKGMQKATHQYYWWLPQNGFEGDFSAEGLRGQRLYVNPKTNTIIVQYANRGFGGYPYPKIAEYFSMLDDEEK